MTVGDAADFGGAAQPFATVRRVAARVKLLPLLSRRVEVGTVELEGLTLNLARDASLRGNWEDLLAAANEPATAAPAAEPGAVSVDELAIEGVRISDGNIYWRENTNELRYSVTGLSLTTGGIGSGEPVEFDAALNFADETSGLKAALAASAVVAAAANGSVTATDLEATVTVDAGDGAPARELAVDGRAHRVRPQGRDAGRRGARRPRLPARVRRGNSREPRCSRTRRCKAASPSKLRSSRRSSSRLGVAPPASLDASELGTFTLGAQFSICNNEPQVVRLARRRRRGARHARHAVKAR